MNIITISGSDREESSNTKLLLHLEGLHRDLHFVHTKLPRKLPLFSVELQDAGIPLEVLLWKKALAEADGVVFCVPEYIHNMPAMIKNALEWIAASGELTGKKVLAMTLTPHEPRGEKAMQSLLWSLQALDANIIASLPLYQTELSYSKEGFLEGDGADVLREALRLFIG